MASRTQTQESVVTRRRRERQRREAVAEALWRELAVGFDVHLVFYEDSRGTECRPDWSKGWQLLRRKRHRDYKEVRTRWLRAADIAIQAMNSIQ